jgi:hypothetical protein
MVCRGRTLKSSLSAGAARALYALPHDVAPRAPLAAHVGDVRRRGRSLRLAAVVVFLLATVYTGIVDGLDAFRSASLAKPMERVGATCQLLYGGLAAAALLASAIARRWILPLLLAWGAALTATGGLAPVVWGEQSVIVGILGGLCTAGIVALVFRAARAHNRSVSGRRRGRTEAEAG